MTGPPYFNEPEKARHYQFILENSSTLLTAESQAVSGSPSSPSSSSSSPRHHLQQQQQQSYHLTQLPPVEKGHHHNYHHHHHHRQHHNLHHHRSYCESDNSMNGNGSSSCHVDNLTESSSSNNIYNNNSNSSSNSSTSKAKTLGRRRSVDVVVVNGVNRIGLVGVGKEAAIGGDRSHNYRSVKGMTRLVNRSSSSETAIKSRTKITTSTSNVDTTAGDCHAAKSGKKKTVEMMSTATATSTSGKKCRRFINSTNKLVISGESRSGGGGGSRNGGGGGGGGSSSNGGGGGSSGGSGGCSRGGGGGGGGGPDLWRKSVRSSYCRRRASRFGSLKLPVLTPHCVTVVTPTSSNSNHNTPTNMATAATSKSRGSLGTMPVHNPLTASAKGGDGGGGGGSADASTTFQGSGLGAPSIVIPSGFDNRGCCSIGCCDGCSCGNGSVCGGGGGCFSGSECFKRDSKTRHITTNNNNSSNRSSGVVEGSITTSSSPPPPVSSSTTTNPPSQQPQPGLPKATPSPHSTACPWTSPTLLIELTSSSFSSLSPMPLLSISSSLSSTSLSQSSTSSLSSPQGTCLCPNNIQPQLPPPQLLPQPPQQQLPPQQLSSSLLSLSVASPSPSSSSSSSTSSPSSISPAPATSAPPQSLPSSNNSLIASTATTSSSSSSSSSNQPNTKTREEFSFIVRGRGLSRAVDESHPPIETIVDDDLLNRTYVANIQKAYESQLNTPCSSGHTSPTIKESQSPLSVSHGGWTTGNTTERSSLDSSYSLDDFDKQAATTVGQHFTEIEALLFEGHHSSSPSTSSSPFSLSNPSNAASSSSSSSSSSNQQHNHHNNHNNHHHASSSNNNHHTSPQADVFRECQEWVTQFPHLRVLGKQACPSKDTGFYHVPPAPHVLNSTTSSSSSNAPHAHRPSSSLMLEPTDYDLNTSASDSQGLSLQGHHLSLCRLPLHTSVPEGDRGELGTLSLTAPSSSSTSTSAAASASSSSSSAVTSLSLVSSLAEEVLEEDGVYEDIIAVDYKNIYEENMENKKQITPRRRREGFPPITPNACVRDSVTSGAFDHIWHEVMSWLRQLLLKYTAEMADSKIDVISFSPTHRQHQTTPASRELSFIQSRQQPFLPMQRSHTHVGSSTDRSIDGILQISSMPLQTRNQLGEVTESQVLSSNRPGSSLNLQHPSRPMSTLRSQRGARGGRLAPLGDRTKTPNTEDERPPNKNVANDALRVRRLPTINDPLPPNFHRNGALPPLEMERTPPRKLLQTTRASSAIDKDMRLLSLRDKAHLVGEQARPNTTHTMRSETPFGGLQNRRSSTPLGTSITARNSMLAKQALDVRGNSLQVVGGMGMEAVGHFHPDILEDTQEGPPQDEVMRTHWNPPPAQVSHNNPYRRGRPYKVMGD